jgi:hypothetical protein
MISHFTNRRPLARIVKQLSATLLVSIIAAAANADTQTLASSGSWRTFGGTDVGGNEVCGMITTWTDGRSFMVKRYGNNHYFTIQVSNPSWSIDDDAIAVGMKLGNNTSWRATASVRKRSPQGLEFTIPALRIMDFIDEFVSSSSMLLVMGDNGVSWRIDLDGTEVVIKSFASCLGEMS